MKAGGGRVLAIGDIHGCSRALDALLAAVEPRPDDEIVTLGDYVDRGPDSCGVIECLLKLRRQCRLVPLRGNHELMMQWAIADGTGGIWTKCGGAETLASYARNGRPGTFADIPDYHRSFLEDECVAWYETDAHFFVHASAEPKVPLEKQPDHVLYWQPFHDPAPHVSGKVMVCGHTAQETGVPRNLGHAVCIDTWVYGDGWLTCLDVHSGKVWQANQAGDRRTARLDDFAENY